MPARYNSSAASSLYSQPIHSRASSRTTVVTPLEDFRTSRYVPTDNLAPVDIPRGRNSKNVSSHASVYSYEQHQVEGARHDEPYGPYFSIPLDRGSKSTPAIRRRTTTKELVGKYESLSSAPSSPPKPVVASPSKQSSLMNPEGPEKKKGRSPIRQSFRNLLSVFSKKGRLTRDLSSTLTPEPLENGLPFESMLSPKIHKLEPLSIPNVSQVSTTPIIACNTPSSLHSGRLLHMSRSTPESLPVWTDCNVLLHPAHMLITWMTSHNNPSTSVVTLAQCTDVRSLALDDLIEEERGMLPTTATQNELFVFELLFEGKSRSKFAAYSIKDRAGWVSAIWDAVLRASEEKIYTPSINALRETTQLETPISSPFRECISNTPSSGTKTALAPASTRFGSPPLTISTPSQAVVSKSPVRVTLYDPPFPKAASPLSTSTPTRTVPSLLPSPMSTRSQSPSIRNLDRISMVRQRLAEIEANTSRCNSPTTPTEKSTRGRQILGTFPESPIGGPKRSVLLRHGTCTTVGGDSVSGVPMSVIQECALEEAPRPLLPVPSGESLGTVTNPWSTYSRLTTPEPLRRTDTPSVASHYSSDLDTTKLASSIRSHSSSTNKPLPQLILALRENSSTDGDRPSSMSSRLDTPTSTRSLSIFSPNSRYSQDAVIQEQANDTPASEPKGVNKAVSPVSSRRSTSVSSPMTVTPSPPETGTSPLRNDSHTPRGRRIGLSESSQHSAEPPATVPHLGVLASVPALSEPSRVGLANKSPPVSTVKSVRNSLSPQGPSPRAPPPNFSVFPPFWQDTDDSALVESQHEAALFSRFAKILPELPTTAGPSVTQETRGISPPSDSGAHKDTQGRLTKLEDKIGDVQVELQNLPGQLRALIPEQSFTAAVPTVVQDVETKKLLRDMDDELKRIENHGSNHTDNLKSIHAKIDTLLSRREFEALAPPVSGLPSISGLPNVPEASDHGGVVTSELMDKLEEMRNNLNNDLPILARKLEELLAVKSSEAPRPVATLAEVFSNNDGLTHSAQEIPEPSVDTTAIHEKLDELLATLQAKVSTHEVPAEATAREEANPLLQQVLNLLNSDKEDRAKIIEQQADSARYLNELNTWLETFVNHGTSQIESVAGGMQQLCSELGASKTTRDDGQVVKNDGLLADIRQMLVENKGRDVNVAALHDSVNGLVAAVQDNLQQGAELRTIFNQDTISGMIEQQRHDQEQMLRNLAHELSDDIRGERLRFVEAMKEATTINVQIHVEEFKKELTREVMLMTQDVDRLHKERQGLEQHIADLFAFYAKQKQVGPGERRKGKQLQQRAPPQNPGPQNLNPVGSQVPGVQNVYYGVPGVPGFVGTTV